MKNEGALDFMIVRSWHSYGGYVPRWMLGVVDQLLSRSANFSIIMLSQV